MILLLNPQCIHFCNRVTYFLKPVGTMKDMQFRVCAKTPLMDKGSHAIKENIAVKRVFDVPVEGRTGKRYGLRNDTPLEHAILAGVYTL